MATLNAAECFDLKTLGAIAPGYQADFFFLTDDLTKLPVHEVFYKGTLVVQSGQLQDHLFADHSNSYTCCLAKTKRSTIKSTFVRAASFFFTSPCDRNYPE